MKRLLSLLVLGVLASQAVAGNYIGEYAPGDTIDCKFATYRPSTGATFTLGGTPAISAYKDNSTTQSTSGVTLSADFDSVTGLNNVRVTTASDGTFYSAGAYFSLIITTGTVDSVSVTGSEVCSFSLNKEAGLRPTVAARQLDVSSGGEAGIDWANIGSPTTSQTLSGTTVGTTTALTNLPSIPNNWITGAGIADGAIDNATFLCTGGSFLILGVTDCGTAQSATSTSLVLRSAAAFADDVPIGNTILAQGSTQGYAQANLVTDYVGSTDTATTATWPVTPSGTITYYKFGTAPSSGGGGGGLDAAGVRSALGMASASYDTDMNTVKGYIDTEVAAILVDTSTTLDDMVDDLESRLGTPSNLGGGATVAANLSDIEGQTDDIGAAGAGLTAADDSVMTRLGTPAGASVSADVAAVKSDSAAILDDTGTNGVVVAAGSKTGYALSSSGIDAIWDEPQSGHATAGTFGVYLDSSVSGVSTGGVSASDIADEVATRTIAGVTTVGTVNALAANAITAAATAADFTSEVTAGLATQTSVDDLPTNSELATALGTADDATLSAIAALPTSIRDLVIEDQGGGITLGCALAIAAAYAGGDLSTTAGTSTYEDASGTETRISGTVASAGNRSATITCPSY